MAAHETIIRAALRRLADGGEVSCGNVWFDMELMLEGLVEIAPDITLRLTDTGRAFLAQGMETAKPLRREVGSARKGDSPVPKGCAQ